MYRVEIHRTTTHKYVMRIDPATKREAEREMRELLADGEWFDNLPDDAWDYVATEGYRIDSITREAV